MFVCTGVEALKCENRIKKNVIQEIILVEFISCYNYLTINYKFLSDITTLLYWVMYVACFGHILTICKH